MSYKRWIPLKKGSKPNCLKKKHMVSLTKNGHLLFNASAAHEFGIKYYNYYDIYFDKETNYIGIKFLHDLDKNEHSRKIYHTKTRHFMYIKLLLSYLNYDIQKTIKRIIKYDLKSELCIFKI